MLIVHTIQELREKIAEVRQAGQIIGFIPTMGNLHDGHLSLVESANKESDFTVASVFVNPTQFGVNEDLDTYPRTLAEDTRQLELAGLDLLFAPKVEEVYPNGVDMQVKVVAPHLSQILCGKSRPVFFTGVATVVAKLFNMVLPDKAFFGEKDFQQLTIIKMLTNELRYPIKIVGVPTVRESNGLAMSSRNGYLSEQERDLAGQVFQQLNSCAGVIKRPEFHVSVETIQGLCDRAMAELANKGFEPDYFSILAQSDLQSPSPSEKNLVILVAVTLGGTRLIDNLQVDLI